MGEVLDSLVVELGLDAASDYAAQSQNAVRATRALEDQVSATNEAIKNLKASKDADSAEVQGRIAQLERERDSLKKKQTDLRRERQDDAEAERKRRKDAEQQHKDQQQASSDFKSLAASATSLLAVVAGFAAVKGVVTGVLGGAQRLGNTAMGLDMDPHQLEGWSKAAQLAGGSAEGLQSTMGNLRRSQQEMALTGSTAALPYFAALGVRLSDANGKARNTTAILEDLSSKFSKMGHARAMAFGAGMGIDNGTMYMLLQGPAKMRALLAQGMGNARSDAEIREEAKTYQDFQTVLQKFERTVTHLVSEFEPQIKSVLRVLDDVADWTKENGPTVKAGFELAAGGFLAFKAATMSLNLNPVAAAISVIITELGALHYELDYWTNGKAVAADQSPMQKFFDNMVFSIDQYVTHMKSALADVLKISNVIGDVIEGRFNLAKQHFYEFLRGTKDIIATTTNDGYTALQMQQERDSGKMYAAPTAGQRATGGRIMDFFVEHGFTKEQAAGIAANVIGESGGNTAAQNPSGAYGLAQWMPDRQKDFKEWSGHDIRYSTMQEQLNFMLHELTAGKYRNVGQQLMTTQSANVAGDLLTKQYERPADPTGAIAGARSMMAQDLAQSWRGTGKVNTLPSQAQSVHNSTAHTRHTSNTTSNSNETHIGTVNVQTNATDAHGIARDIHAQLENQFNSPFASFATQTATGLA